MLSKQNWDGIVEARLMSVTWLYCSALVMNGELGNL